MVKPPLIVSVFPLITRLPSEYAIAVLSVTVPARIDGLLLKVIDPALTVMFGVVAEIGAVLWPKEIAATCNKPDGSVSVPLIEAPNVLVNVPAVIVRLNAAKLVVADIPELLLMTSEPNDDNPSGIEMVRAAEPLRMVVWLIVPEKAPDDAPPCMKLPPTVSVPVVSNPTSLPPEKLADPVVVNALPGTVILMVPEPEEAMPPSVTVTV